MHLLSRCPPTSVTAQKLPHLDMHESSITFPFRCDELRGIDVRWQEAHFCMRVAPPAQCATTVQHHSFPQPLYFLVKHQGSCATIHPAPYTCYSLSLQEMANACDHCSCCMWPPRSAVIFSGNELPCPPLNVSWLGSVGSAPRWHRRCKPAVGKAPMNEAAK